MTRRGHLCEDLLDVDIALTVRPDVADLKAVGLEAVFDEAGFLDPDPLLALVVDDEARRRRPDVSDTAKSVVAPLMDVAAGDEAQVDARKHLDQALPCRLRYVADGGVHG